MVEKRFVVVGVAVIIGIEDESTGTATVVTGGGGGNDARIWTMVVRRYIPFDHLDIKIWG